MPGCGGALLGAALDERFKDLAIDRSGIGAFAEFALGGDFQHRFSVVVLGAFMFLIGTQAVMIGLLAEMQVRTYHEPQSKPIYIVSNRTGFPEAAVPAERS